MLYLPFPALKPLFQALMSMLLDAGGQTQAWVTVGPKSRLPKQAPPSLLLSLSAEAGDGRGNSSRWEPDRFVRGGSSWNTERVISLSLSLSRSRLDHRLQSGLEDDQKAARTKAPKLHRRLSPTTVTLIIEWALNAELGPEMTWDVFSSNQITAVIRFHAFTCTSGIR